jgi:hypothetical protein
MGEPGPDPGGVIARAASAYRAHVRANPGFVPRQQTLKAPEPVSEAGLTGRALWIARSQNAWRAPAPVWVRQQNTMEGVLAAIEATVNAGREATGWVTEELAGFLEDEGDAIVSRRARLRTSRSRERGKRAWEKRVEIFDAGEDGERIQTRFVRGLLADLLRAHGMAKSKIDNLMHQTTDKERLPVFADAQTLGRAVALRARLPLFADSISPHTIALARALRAKLGRTPTDDEIRGELARRSEELRALGVSPEPPTADDIKDFRIASERSGQTVRISRLHAAHLKVCNELGVSHLSKRGLARVLFDRTTERPGVGGVSWHLAPPRKGKREVGYRGIVLRTKM